MNNLTREQVETFLKKARPDMSEDDWKNADLITVLTWAIPTYIAWQKNGYIDYVINS